MAVWKRDVTSITLYFPDLDFLSDNNIMSSKNEARRAIANNGLKINNNLINDEKKIIYPADFKEGVLKISHGKKKHYQVKIF